MVITPSTKLFGLVGYPVAHSLSPAMHNRAFSHLGLNAVYLPFAVEPERIGQMVQAAKTLGICGFNVTIPHKETIIASLDELSEEAAAFRSVNTVVVKDGRACGYNTDGPGFMASLKEADVYPAGEVVILGAGGAARSIGYALAKAGCIVTFIDHPVERAAKLAGDIGRLTETECRSLDWEPAGLKRVLDRTSLVINATPIGMSPSVHQAPSLEFDWINSGAVICDIVYNPLKTRFLQLAAENGHRTVSGLGMFVHQGALSFTHFTGIKAPIQIMRETIQSLLETHE
ncbi:MAG: shikimate dehydrogenase [Solirubrobacterales bacterium]